MALATATGTAAGQPVTVEQVQKVWADREAKAQTVRAKVSVRDFLPKGLLRLSRVGRPELGPQPPTDVTLHSTCELTLDGVDGRLDQQGEEWSPLDNKAIQADHRSTVTGGTASSLDATRHSNGQGLSMVVKGAGPTSVLDSAAILPLLVTLRGTTLGAKGWDPCGFSVKVPSTVVNNRPCLWLSRAAVTRVASWHLYLDLERGFLPVRLEAREANRVTLEVDVTSRPDPAVGWVPDEWRVGGLADRFRKDCRLDALTVGEPVGDDGLRLRPPPGTRVIDYRDGKQELHSLVRPDGSPGVPVPRGASGDPTDAVLEAANRRATRFRWAVVAGGSLGAAVAVSAAWTRLDRRRRPPFG